MSPRRRLPNGKPAIEPGLTGCMNLEARSSYLIVNARGESRTRTGLPPVDFES